VTATAGKEANVSEILILYATWHGHAQEVAERIASVARSSGVNSQVHEAREFARSGMKIDGFDGVIVAGSVHFGTHGAALRNAVRAIVPRMSRLRSAFVSISGAAASLDGQEAADGYLQRFLRDTGWKPDATLSCAGAIRYSRYDPFTRWLMRFTSRVAGRTTDMSGDHVYTDWAVLVAFAQEFIESVKGSKRAAA